MPGKNRGKNHGGKKGGRGRPKVKGNGVSTTVSAEFDRFSYTHMPFAPVFRTKMCCTWAGTLPAGSATSGYFYVSGNSAHTPFNSTQVAATRAISYYSVTGYQSESYSTTQPEGYSAICSSTGPYYAYRVLASHIKVKFAPTSTADNMFASVNCNQTGQQSTTTIWTNDSSPYSTGMKSFTSIEQKYWLTKSMSTGQLFSVPQSAIRTGDAWIAEYNASPTNEWCWVIQWQVVDNTTTNAIMGIAIQVEYDIEFIQPNTGALPDTFKAPKIVVEPRTPAESPVAVDKFDLVLDGKAYKQVDKQVRSKSETR